MKKTAISLHILTKEKIEITEIAQKRGVSNTQIMREALQLYLKVQHNVNPCPACGLIKKGKK